MRRLILVFVLAPVLLSLTSCSRTCAAEHVTLTMQSADPSLLLPGNNQTIGVRITVPSSADPVHVTARFFDVFKIPIMRGRGLTERDSAAGRRWW